MRSIAIVSLTTMTLVALDDARAQSNPGEDERKMHPISLKCPIDNSSILEYVTQNLLGVKNRIRVHFANEHVKRITVEYANVDAPFRLVNDIDTKSERDREIIEYSRLLERLATKLQHEVCEGPPNAREEYFEKLRANARKVGAPTH